MKEQVADTVKSERSAVLLALEKAQSLEYRKMYIGKRLEVLIEELTEIDGRSYYTGYTKNYIRVAIAAMSLTIILLMTYMNVWLISLYVTGLLY